MFEKVPMTDLIICIAMIQNVYFLLSNQVPL